LLLFLSACGSGGEGGGNPSIGIPITITGAAVKGDIVNGTLTAYAIVDGVLGDPVSTTLTNESGGYTLSFSDYSGPLILEVTGGSFIDEATGLSFALPSARGLGLRAVIQNVDPGQTVRAAITPLSTMAVERAFNLPGGLTSENIDSANALIGDYFGGIDILAASPINPLIPDSAIGIDQNAVDYGLILAGISQQAENLGLASPMVLLEAFSNDMGDGRPDGLNAGSPIALDVKHLRPTALGSDLAAAIKAFSDDRSRNRSGGAISTDLIKKLSNPSLGVMIDPLGTGSGKITADRGEIDCGAHCNEAYLGGTSVILTATADPDSVFTDWGGNCSGNGVCILTMDGNKSVSAKFDLGPPSPLVTHTLTVTKTGAGGGTVTSATGNINCGATCSRSYVSGATETLTARPAAGSFFAGWSGACAGSDSCALTMNGNKTATAQFDLVPVVGQTLTVTKVGTAGGTVTSNTGAINCGAVCSDVYLKDTLVTLKPTPVSGSKFVEWSGACTGSSPCVVKMDVNKTVTARFDLLPLMTQTLSVIKDETGSGGGAVTSNPEGIDCGLNCTQDYASGTSVTLTPTPVAGSIFVGWGGACAGTGPCVVVMDADKSVTAKFNAALPTPVFSVSGSISYAGSKTGRIYIRLIPFTTTDIIYGTSIASPGPFTIRGVPSDFYSVEAYLDHRSPASGVRNVSNPIGKSANPIFVTGNMTGANLSLQDPTSFPPPLPPSAPPRLFPFDGGVLAQWKPVKNANGIETPESYRIYWATTPGLSPSVFDGSQEFFARDEGQAVVTGLSNGETLWFVLTSIRGGIESTSTAAAFVTVGEPAGDGATVSGTVSFAGQASGSLYVILKQLSNNRYFIDRIDQALSPQSYRLTALPKGLYRFSTVLDSDNNGVLGDAGDLSSAVPDQILAISDADLTVNVDLTGAGSFAETTTLNIDGDPCCARRFRVVRGSKLPVALVLSGPHLPLMDLYRSGRGQSAFDMTFPAGSLPAPLVADDYQFDVRYADGTSEIISAKVSGVLSRFPAPLFPTGSVPGETQPLFSWSPPSGTLPAPYYFNLKLGSTSDFSEIWAPNVIPSLETSLLYNADGSAALPSLISGQTYRWRIGIEDVFGNAALTSGTDFVP